MCILSHLRGKYKRAATFQKAESDKMPRFFMWLLYLYVATASARSAAISESGRKKRVRAMAFRLPRARGGGMSAPYT
jgi:hypothetical protein